MTWVGWNNETMSTAPRYDEVLMLPRAVRFPVEMLPPVGFDPTKPETWPSVAGRLEFVEGKLWFMPPTGDLQQDTVSDVVITLGGYVRSRAGFVLGTNEAGMILQGATRAADVAVWRAADLGAYRGGLRRVPPLLAVEVSGPDSGDEEEALRAKAAWYLEVGVPTVWLVLPDALSVIVVTTASEERFDVGDELPQPAGMEGLVVPARELFHQRLARG